MPTRSPPRKRGAGAARHLACVLLISVQAHERPAAAIANARVVANEQPWSLAFEEDGRRRLSSSELEKLTASDGAAAHNFGRSVAIEGNTVVIGAPGAGTGGAAYVLRTTDGGNTYVEVDLLTASDGAAGDDFGYAVAVKGATVMIGAPDRGDNNLGAVYVFRTTDNATYTQVDILAADDAAADDELRFGWAVAMDGDALAISAYKQNAAYVFRTTDGGASYGQVAKLTASDAGSNDKFAYSLDISGGVVAIGAMASPGAVYVFRTGDGRRRN